MEVSAVTTLIKCDQEKNPDLKRYEHFRGGTGIKTWMKLSFCMLKVTCLGESAIWAECDIRASRKKFGAETRKVSDRDIVRLERWCADAREGGGYPLVRFSVRVALHCMVHRLQGLDQTELQQLASWIEIESTCHAMQCVSVPQCHMPSTFRILTSRTRSGKHLKTCENRNFCGEISWSRLSHSWGTRVDAHCKS